MANKISKLLCLAGIAVAASAAPPAHAQSAQQTSCVIDYVQYSEDQLVVRCASTGSYYGVFGPSFSSCSGKQTADTMKVMSSMAQGAYLSGRPILFNYFPNSCNGGPSIVLMSLGQ